jgi:DNA-binding LacI/PurR family transcriptional regulator
LNFRLATARAVERGYRRIGFLAAPSRNERRRRIYNDQIRLRRWHLENEVGPQPATLWLGPADGAEALERWLATERPDVVIADHVDRCAALQALGTALPKGLGLIGLVNRTATPPNEPLSQVNVRRVTVFRHALTILHDAILREEYGTPAIPVRMLIPGGWHEGRTLPSLA